LPRSLSAVATPTPDQSLWAHPPICPAAVEKSSNRALSGLNQALLKACTTLGRLCSALPQGMITSTPPCRLSQPIRYCPLDCLAFWMLGSQPLTTSACPLLKRPTASSTLSAEIMVTSERGFSPATSSAYSVKNSLTESLAKVIFLPRKSLSVLTVP